MRTTRSGLAPARRWWPRRATVWRSAIVALLLLAAAGMWSRLDAAGSSASATPTQSGSAPPAPASTAASTLPSIMPQPDRPDGPGLPAALPGPPAAPPPLDPTRGRLPVPEGLVGVPVTLPTSTATAMLHPGDRVDLFVTLAATDSRPVLVARDASVLAVDRAAAALLLGLTTDEAHEVVAWTAASASFAVILRP
jgi:hypothetical protein